VFLLTVGVLRHKLLANKVSDLNYDCVVNYEDVETMADERLETDVNPGEVQVPKDANLIGWWKFDDGDGSMA